MNSTSMIEMLARHAFVTTIGSRLSWRDGSGGHLVWCSALNRRAVSCVSLLLKKEVGDI